MKLHYNPASPFVRKVRVVAIETGLADAMELVPERVSPVTENAAVSGDNPIGKIPTLVLDGGGTLFDSRVICEYLDTLHDGTPLFPPDGESRWRALRRQALADGMMDAAVGARYETILRPQALRWSEWVDGQKGKFRRGADLLETETLDGTMDIGTISVACALGYLDFRYPDEDWRATRPNLRHWFETFAARESMVKTAPADLA